MMPEHLLEELMNSATQHGVKTALIMAFEHGKLESYREFMQDVAKPKFTPRVYDRDWVSQEGD